MDSWWQPNSDGDDWKGDELKAREAHALLRERLRHILRLVPRDALYKWRLTADSQEREWIDEELELRGPGGEPRPFQGLGE